MFAYFLAILLVMFRVLADNDLEPIEQCDGVVYRGTYYDKFKLFQGLRRPTNLLLHRYSGTLFFSHLITNGTLDFSIMSCHIKSRNCKAIRRVPGGRAIAYDRLSNLIYFGGSDGIYTYDVKYNDLKYFGEQGKSIWGICIRKSIFYIEYPTMQVYTLTDGMFRKVPKLDGVDVDVFYVSRSSDMYFYSKTALYVVDVETKMTIILSDNIVVTQITEDINGDIFVSANDGVYMHAMEIGELVKIANVDNVYGIAFAEIGTSEGKSNQLIYSDENSINILVPSVNQDICSSY